MKYGDELLDLHGKHVTLARLISRTTPAPLINLYVGIIYSFFSPIGLGPVVTPTGSLLLCIIFMVILPVMPIVLEAMRGKVDLDVSIRETRPKFFVFALVVYFLAYSVYTFLGCVIMSALAAAYFTVTLGVAITSLRTKVSVHGAGVGGPGTSLIYVYGLLAVPVVFVWVIVIWARTTLKQHTLIQAIAGVLLGVIITLLTYPFVYII